MRFILLLLLPLAAQAFDGRVVGVIDGDTLQVVDASRRQHTIRLAGVAAPLRTQAFGQTSRSSLSALVFNREVSIVGDHQARDGHSVARVLAADPNCNVPACPKFHDVGLMQIGAGMAWWYPADADRLSPAERENYTAAEFNAKLQRLGLWAGKNPRPPWEAGR